ncbi:MAG TPA: type II toxin-antitoxin system PemK/MazF family toxin [Acidobacteriaceae bacterium]
MKRGDLVLVAPAGEFGKPRPALIIQSDAAFPSGNFTYLPITSDLLRVPDIRVPVTPNPKNGLRQPSEIMVDMIQTSSLARFGGIIGTIDASTLRSVESALALHVGLDQ